ncbi:hypothetical protein DCS_07518 [Drechmeria coniospora]|uniref:WLM domain-containing protein n=1 Tax=Drechmeria coniospora TaxID=98403 RepID=A0A151GEN8_DRECN|nr:hypothetical protein DCS_07518 [Drechmeria coniospora]KYK55555.1 hypothetical protein DCS_07518 [Drechmeria coniospora]
MRKHHLYVLTLEEYEPNREFVGRNFNAGEVVQLVLKSPRTGRWLPFEYVQMVMMHELAHCKQMNHSRAFWAVRNSYAAEMYSLMGEAYTGEGIWGRGARLASGEWERNVVQPDEALTEHLCGGTYRSRGRKRTTKATLTYQERKERRIEKKFGKNGVALGADEVVKATLEKGKKLTAKPRVAGSARGRELRAAAALARFEQQKGEDMVKLKKETAEEAESESGSESEYEEGDSQDLDSKDAIDVDGRRLLDRKGRGMVKVCEDEDANDPDAKQELDELRGVFGQKWIKSESTGEGSGSGPNPVHGRAGNKKKLAADEGEPSRTKRAKAEPSEALFRSKSLPRAPVEKVKQRDNGNEAYGRMEPSQATSSSGPLSPQQGVLKERLITCSACSFANARQAATCHVCANVLAPDDTTNLWRCRSRDCLDSKYINSGDCAICGVCGRRRDDASTFAAT